MKRLGLALFHFLAIAGLLAHPVAAQEVALVDSIRTNWIAAVGSSVFVVPFPFGRLRRSDDGGVMWRESSSDSTRFARTVTSCPDGEVILGTSNGIFSSVDSGNTWILVTPRIAGGFDYEFSCLPNGDIVLGPVGDELDVYRRGSGDFETVATADPNASDAVWTVSRGSADRVWAGYRGCQESSCGGLFVSSDGGISFEEVPDWSNNWAIEAIASIDSFSVFVNGSDIVRVRDPLTLSWMSVPKGVYNANKILPVGGDTLIAVGDSGVQRSRDGGRNWITMFDRFDAPAHDVVRLDDGSVLVASTYGVLRSRAVFGTRTSSDRDRKISELHLYPNPFSEFLVVESSCMEPITVFDIVGRDRTSVVPVLHQGRSKKIADVSRLASGMYLFATCCEHACSVAKAVKIDN